MNNKDFYKSTFSQIHTTTNFNLEHYNNMKNKQIQRRKTIAAAASICIILAASTTAYAMNLFGLKDMLIGNTNTQSVSNPTSQDHPEPLVSPEAFISLQGFSNSNEFKAVAEWTSFCDNYDKDGTFLEKVGNGPTGLDPKYDGYLVYTQEMADKLDEIVKKYNLALHSSSPVTVSTKELIEKVGTGNFLGSNIGECTYLYEDGSFKTEGYSNLTSKLTIDYTLLNYKKGIFYDTSINIGNINDYDEWNYTTTCGIKVHLAMSPKKSFIFADLGDSFMTIIADTDVMHGKGMSTSSLLEAFSDTFDFSLLKSTAASSIKNNKTSKIKIPTREGIIGEFQSLLSKLPKINEVYTFIKDNAKDAKKKEVTEMLINMESMMQNKRGAMYEEFMVPKIQDAFTKADKTKIDINQADKLQDGTLKTLVEKAKANGLLIQKFSTGYCPVIDYTTYKELSAYATEDMIAYVNMMAIESATPYEKDSSLAIGWDELIKRALSAEEFLKKYESSSKASDVQMLYDEYKMNLLGCSTIPVFDEKTKVMNADAKKAFETSIISNPNSYLAEMLKEFLNVLSQNGNRLNDKVDEFREDEIYGGIGE